MAYPFTVRAMKKFANSAEEISSSPAANKRRLEKTLKKMLGSDFVFSSTSPFRNRTQSLPHLRAMAK